MARQLSGLGIFAKWLVVPAIMGATGYYLIGPRIGGEIPAWIRYSTGRKLGRRCRFKDSSITASGSA